VEGESETTLEGGRENRLGVYKSVTLHGKTTRKRSWRNARIRRRRRMWVTGSEGPSSFPVLQAVEEVKEDNQTELFIVSFSQMERE
jgi:hypothetical protein